MNKKWSATLFLILVLGVLAGCGGGGSGSSSEPTGVNPGVPSSVQLLPVQVIAQTGSDIFLKAKVLDGNGNVLKDVPVTFTNFSSMGVLSSNVAVTDVHGIATVSLRSNIPGFITVQAEVASAAGQVRDRRSMFFSEFDLTFPPEPPGPPPPVPTLSLEVDGNGNGIFNEPDDFIMFQDSSDNQLSVRATVFDENMVPVVNSNVTFGSDSEEASFPLGDVKLTDVNGQALILVQVDPSSIRNFSIPLNITALAENGAGNIITVFLNPVTVGAVSVFADPSTVSAGATSQITVTATTSAGGQLPAGTIVNFSASCGQVTPFSEVDNGIATATFSPPEVPGTCTITASVGGIDDTVDVTSSTALSVQPGAVTINGNTGGTASFAIFGGTPGYTITSNNPLFPASTSFVSTSGGSFTVSVPTNTPNTSITYTIRDATGSTTTASLTVSGLDTLSVQPGAVTINGNTGGTASFTIFGGTPGYTITSNNPLFPASTSFVSTSGGSFTVSVPTNTPNTSITYTIRDATGSTTTASLTVSGLNTLSVLPSSQSINGDAGGTATFTILGGKPSYFIVSNNPAIPPSTSFVGASGGTFSVVVPAGSPATSVSYTIRDTTGATFAATLMITEGEGPPPDFFLRPEDVTISAGQSVTYIIFGGTAPFTIFADRPGDATVVYPGGTSFTVVGINPATVTITVRDSTGQETETILTIQ